MEKKDTRSGFGDGLLELGKQMGNVVALCADLTKSMKMEAFRNHCPDRFFQVGIAEANMIGIAAGMTIGGKIPYTGSFANFTTGRVYDQIRQSIAYSNKNVKICASHAGLTLGEDGATHQILEDIGLMKMLPNMTVICPCDYNQTRAATIAIANHYGPVYLRFGRPKLPVFTSKNDTFEIGKSVVMKRGRDITIIATGHLVWESIIASDFLLKKGIDAEIINVHTIKPLDKDTILDSIASTRAVVVAEEHQINGGLGDSIAQLLSIYMPTKMKSISINDMFGESGDPYLLMQKYKIDYQSIVNSALNLLSDCKK
ncbi:MAG: transketolase family protein [Bacteroides sp.]|nr:MAG: transketolase family protein [Bacteroides sp.]